MTLENRGRRASRRAGALLIMMLAAVRLAADSTPSLASEQRPLVVRFAVSADLFYDVSPKDAQVALEVWAKTIASSARRPVHASGRVLSDLDALVAVVERNEAEVVGLPTMEYLRLRDRIPVEPALVGSRQDGPLEEHVLLARHDGGFQRLGDLKGKRLVMQSGTVGAMARAWLDLLLATQGHPEMHRFFGSVKSVAKASQAVLPVFFRQADAAVVTRTSYATLLEMNPQVPRDLAPIAQSPKLLLTVMCFHRNADEDVRRLVVDNALDLEQSAGGRQVLLLFKTTRVIPFKPVHLEGVWTLFQDSRALRGGFRRG